MSLLVERNLFGQLGHEVRPFRTWSNKAHLAFQNVPNLRQFIDRVVYSADQLAAEDFDAIRNAGASDDAILEIIYCASLGAGLGRLRAVCAAMAGTAR